MQEPAASEEIYRGKVVTLRVETVPEPIGGTRRFEIVEHAEGVAIVAVREGKAAGEPEVALVRQRRPAVGRELWEVPAGQTGPEDQGVPERAASRELAEEIGYRATVWRLLTRELTSPGFTNERISIFLATDLLPAAGYTPDAAADSSEIAAVHWMPLGEALEMCRAGAIEDGKTIAGLLLARDALAAHGARYGGEVPRAPVGGAAPEAEARAQTSDGADARRGRDGEQPERDPRLTLEKMLIEEFKYARQSTAEAIEDRARMFDRYLLLVGGVLAAGVGSIYQLSQLDHGQLVQPVALAVFLICGILGVIFFATLVRLRGAYRGSLLYMNVIKEYYIAQFRPTLPNVDSVFMWRLGTMPRHERFGSVWYLVTHMVALIGSLCFGTASLIGFELRQRNTGDLLVLPTDPVSYALAAGVCIAAFVLQRRYFTGKVNNQSDKQAAEERLKRFAS